MGTVSVTALYAGILGLLLVALSLRVVIVARVGAQIPYGDGGENELTPVIRSHGNFIEYVPMALLLIGFVEFTGTSNTLIHGLGIALVIARVLHAAGLKANQGPTFGRVAGAAITWLVIAIAAVLSLLQYFSAGPG